MGKGSFSGGGDADKEVPGWLSCLGIGGYSYEKVKWNYMLLLMMHAILTWICRDVGHHIVGSFSKFQMCKEAGVEEAMVDRCLSKEAVLRLAFATFLFFAIHAAVVVVVAFFSPEHPIARQVVHAGFFPLKVVMWFGLIAVCFTTMGPTVFKVFFQIARVSSGIFLLFQLVVLLDFVYDLNAVMVDNEAYRAPLVILSLILGLVTLSGIGALYHFFAPQASCSLHIFFITFTLILVVAVTALSVSPLRTEAAGLLTSLLICAYSVYVLTSALYSRPAGTCSPVPENLEVTWILVLGFVITLVCLVIACLNLGKRSKSFTISEGTEEPDAELPYNAVFFHLVFTLAVCYFLMLFTNWSLLGAPGKFRLDQGTASSWIKIVTQWVCFGLYAWTLVAERVLSGRNFS